MLLGQVEDVLGGLLECGLLVVADIALLALGEAVYEEGAVCLAVEDDRAIAVRLSLAGASDSLLDDTAAEVGIDQALLGPLDGIT